MATWDIQITVKDVARKEVALRAVRTEGAFVRTYTLTSVIIETGPQKLAAMDVVWNLFQAELAEESVHAGVIATLEADAKANLEARE